MTTLASAPPQEISPVPLRRLAWVAWRRNRASVLGLSGLLAALAAYLVVTGLQMHAAYDDLGSCVPPITTDACQVRWTSFVDSHGSRGLIGPLLLVLPGIVGAIIGAPLIGRELESGVFRYSWTQGAGRMRWAGAVITPITTVSIVLMGALGLLISWRNQPMITAGAAQRLDSSSFPTTGLAVVGWTTLYLRNGPDDVVRRLQRLADLTAPRSVRSPFESCPTSPAALTIPHWSASFPTCTLMCP